MKTLAIIPARGGSKRIPGKNIRNFLGRPIISYSIDAAGRAGVFDALMVSTDDQEIARIAMGYGAEVPFMRGDKCSDDYATLADVVVEVLENYERQRIRPEYVCCIMATAPLIDPEKIKQGFDLISARYDSVIPVVPFGYPIQRSLKIDENDKLLMVEPRFKNTRSQDLPQRYHDAGQFYWIKADVIKEKGTFFTDNTGAIIQDPLTVQDIDTEEDWRMAEFKYRNLYGE
ncbi:MAG: pseudaminic acid cytidylyltransferase [Rikenellaceae bacterium]|nr:pseudaminic acid cytidylyltransferase [Rikenellaceae bacterium]